MKTENRALDLSIKMLNGYDNKKPYSVDTDFDDKGNDDFSSLTRHYLTGNDHPVCVPE
jgi:hypothetical protein